MFKFVVLCALVASGWAFKIRTPNIGARIVGGEGTTINKHPYQVSLRYFNTIHGCSGSIIGDRWILTAANCVEIGRPPFSIHAGVSYLGVSGQVLTLKEIHVHPKYNSISMDHDIAILELDTPVEFGPDAQIVPLVDEDFEPIADSDVTYSGWGSFFEGGPLSVYLQKVDLKIVDKGICRDKYYKFHITDTMICAGVPEGGKGFCYADNGGPLVGADGKLVGIVSFSKGCGNPEYPGVYTHVSYFRSFIKNMTGI